MAGEGLLPRYPLVSVPYALLASSAAVAGSVSWSNITGIPGGIGSVAAGSITAGTLPTDVVASSVAANAVGTSQLADGSVTDAKIVSHLTGTASIGFGTTGAATCEDSSTPIPVTGARNGDPVFLGIPAGLMTSDVPQTFFGYVSSDDNVTVRRCNVSGSALTNPGSFTVRADVWHH